LVVHPLADEGAAKCAKCGLPYAPNRPETYATRPMMLRWRLWFPGLVLATLTGVVAYAAIRGVDTMGPALFFGVPFAVGAILGYSMRVSAWLSLLFGLLAIGSIVFALVTMSFSGIFCGITLGLIFLVPTLVGGLFGWLVRKAARRAAWDRRSYAFLAVFVALPFGAERVERLWPTAHEVAEVRTAATFAAPADRAWRAIVFYEQVEHEPPFLLTLALPRPVRAEGRKDSVGAVQRCVYQRGYLLKRITRHEPPRALMFEVIEQHLHFEHDVELLDGGFFLEPIDDGRTKVVLMTRYRRLLRPAWLWEPMEREIIHTLHRHVLTGMRQRAEGG
jgi:hypothetical protein